MPVLVSQNRGDDVVAASGTDRMVRGWRSKGTDVTVTTMNLPTVFPGTFLGHGVGMAAILEAVDWLGAQEG